MTAIKHLFDPSKEIYRKIEKVVTFGNLQDDFLNKEIAEYVVTTRLRDSFEALASALHDGLRNQSHEVGIWVSGFYGSGKSSFAKYLGLALDKNRLLDGVPVRERLANRIDSVSVGQLLKSLVEQYNPQVFLIDLASMQASGHTLAPVGTILYNEVMKWAGYAPEEKLAYFERTLELDGKVDAFRTLVREKKGFDWDAIKKENLLVAKGIAASLAPELYPQVWATPQAFQQTEISSLESEKDRMTRMLELIRRKSGKPNVIFILDEVGQYIASKEELILQLQGTLENLKDLGQGKAWLLATAQQTLTVDDPKARYNSDKLFKLNDRFPVKVDIEAADIKEITTKRLLGKSPEGRDALKQLFARYGDQLRIYTKLEDAEKTIFKEELTEASFIDLYPFLPNHFTLLLTLLGKLAATQRGGIGLRSAIRVIQDVLTEGKRPFAEESTGALATAVQFFDILRADLQKSYNYVVEAVDKVGAIYGPDSEHLKLAKAIGVLQIVDDFPLTASNLAVMMHPSVDSPSRRDMVRTMVDEIKANRTLTLKEIDGQLRFMTDAILRVEDAKNQHVVTTTDVRRTLVEQVEQLFTTPPLTKLLNEKTVRTGLQLQFEGRAYVVSGQDEDIQTVIHFETHDHYDGLLAELKTQSTETAQASRQFALGLLEESFAADVEEIVRCEAIYGRRGQYSEKEIGDYLEGQRQEAERLKQRLRTRLASALEAGEVVFRGGSKPSRSYAPYYRDALAACLRGVAEKVFSKYHQAARNIEGDAAKKLLQFDDLKQVPESLNPLGLIKADGSIDTTAPALKSIVEFLQREGQAEGRKLLEYFGAPEYGWSKDTTRYLVAVLFLSSVVQLRIGGETIAVKGPQSIEKLSNVTGFNQIAVMLQTGNQPTNEQRKHAALNLTAIIGNANLTVSPLPQKISETVLKHFPHLLHEYAGLDTRLQALGLPGSERVLNLKGSITQCLQGDASDATFRLGQPDAPLYVDLLWAKKLHAAFGDRDLERTVRTFREVQTGLSELPDVAAVTALRQETESAVGTVRRILETDDFFERLPDLRDALGRIQASVETACQQFREEENAKIEATIERIRAGSDFQALTAEQQEEVAARLDAARIGPKSGVAGLKEIVNDGFRFYDLQTEVTRVVEEYTRANEASTPPRKTHRLKLPRRLETADAVDQLITDLQTLKTQLAADEIVELDWN